MPNTSVVEIPLPKNPEVFEALVWALFKELWGDATAQLHGRKGQAQSGIDIIGYDRRDGNGLVGIQCKVRGRGKRLSQRTLAKEVEKAKSFHPAISKFILATTALRDAKLQKAALELTEEHRAQGLFEVAIVAWEDIELLLSENSSILHWYSPDLFPPAFDGATEIVAPLDPGNEFRQIVGRKFVKESLLRFIRGKESGVFLLVGPPGIGKTALMANAAHELSSLCASGAAITFRFRRTSAQSSASVFIRSIYFALAKSRGVSTEQLPPDTDRSAAYFERLLNRVAPPPASASPDHGRAFEAGDTDAAWGQTNDLPITSDGARYEIFVIDAIDEADDPLLICRLLPQTLPPGVFFIISSRTGRHLDGFKALAHRCEVFPIEPLSADNLADATRFLTEMIDGWPQEIYEAIAQQARGNFLFLKLFADYAVANGVSADDGLRLAAEYGGGKEEMLTAFYEQYWLHLREESEKGGDDDSRFVDELVGLLAICFTGLTREQIICFLGWEWTVARFERTLKYVRQFLETIAALPGPLESDEKRFRLFHDTFEAFVRNRLNPDLSQLHGRVVEAYFSLSVPGFDPAKLDDYGLDHLVKHSVRCNYPDRVYEIVTPAYVKHKMGKRNSAGSILEDLDAVIGAALAEGEIELAFKYGLLESHLVASVNTPFLGIESFLRARMGETEAPLADVKTFGTPEDEILIHAEITAMTGKRDPDAATDHIRKISLLAFSCVPEVIELTVSRLAEADPIAALALSQRIPDPKLLMNVLNNREYPNKGRSLFKVFKEISVADPEATIELVARSTDTSERIYRLVAQAAAVLVNRPSVALEAFREAMELVEDEESRPGLSFSLARYVHWHLPSMLPEGVVVALEGLSAISPLPVNNPLFAEMIDGILNKDPVWWKEKAKGIQSRAAKELILWRLMRLDHMQLGGPESFQNELVQDFVRAANIAQLEAADLTQALSLTEDFKTLEGFTEGIALVAEQIQKASPETAERIIDYGIRSIPKDSDWQGFVSVTRLFKVAAATSGRVRERTLYRCLKDALKVEPEFMRSDTVAIIYKILADAFVNAKPNQAKFFQSFIREQSGESPRRFLASKLAYPVNTLTHNM